MPKLREQIMPRRKLMLIASECLIFTGVLFLGTSYPPLVSREFVLSFRDWDCIHFLLSCLTIAILSQACLWCLGLYGWKVTQNRGKLPNRLLHSGGTSLVLLAVLVFLLPHLFHFPGLRDVGNETWKLILLLVICYVLVFALRAGFHRFFFPTYPPPAD